MFICLHSRKYASITLLVISLLSLILCISYGDKKIRWELRVMFRFFLIGTVGAGASSSFIVSDSKIGPWEVDKPQCFPGVVEPHIKPVDANFCRDSDCGPYPSHDPSVLNVLTDFVRCCDLRQPSFYLFWDGVIGNSIDFLSIEKNGLSIILLRQK